MNHLKMHEEISVLQNEAAMRKLAKEKARVERNKDLPETVKMSYGAKKLGLDYVSYQSDRMTNKFKEYRALGYLYEDAVELTMRWIAKEEDVFNQDKINNAIHKVLSFDPTDEVRCIRFIGQHMKISMFLFALLLVAVDAMFVNLFALVFRIEWLTFLLIIIAVFTNMKMIFNYVRIVVTLKK